jgi:hypothetical protein
LRLFAVLLLPENSNNPSSLRCPKNPNKFRTHVFYFLLAVERLDFTSLAKLVRRPPLCRLKAKRNRHEPTRTLNLFESNGFQFGKML